LTSCPDIAVPASGGVIEEKARIALSEELSLTALSYRGDLAGWKAKIVAYCNSDDRIWGVISNNKLMLSDGRALDLGECHVLFDA
jgi:hypothetical protein